MLECIIIIMCIIALIILGIGISILLKDMFEDWSR